MDRAQFLRLAAGALAGVLLAPARAMQPSSSASKAAMNNQIAHFSGAMPKRPIPSSREMLPVIGCGTYVGFDVPMGSPRYQGLPAVLAALYAAGGSVLDSSPMYGRAEEVTGALLAAAGSRAQAFVATKVWTSGREAGIRQMEESMRRLQCSQVDLMQIHNLLDWRTHLKTLRDWKAQGRIRYIGVTHYTASAYAELEAVMRAEALDFIQINYAINDREAERRILPLARERGMAVLVNTPFGGGNLLRRLHERPLPPWAAEIGAASWAQVLLKFVLSHPATTCAIPGTARAEHMAQNAEAALGPLPDQAFWARHADAIGI
ncbi:MAG: aldo/keto reductase [Janthinobacterium lividum]